MMGPSKMQSSNRTWLVTTVRSVDSFMQPVADPSVREMDFEIVWVSTLPLVPSSRRPQIKGLKMLTRERQRAVQGRHRLVKHKE
jgi:hypothetical protein